jgi:hypothetical protein
VTYCAEHGDLPSHDSASTATAMSSTTRSGVQNRARPRSACRPSGPPIARLAAVASGSVQVGDRARRPVRPPSGGGAARHSPSLPPPASSSGRRAAPAPVAVAAVPTAAVPTAAGRAAAGHAAVTAVTAVTVTAAVAVVPVEEVLERVAAGVAVPVGAVAAVALAVVVPVVTAVDDVVASAVVLAPVVGLDDVVAVVVDVLGERRLAQGLEPREPHDLLTLQGGVHVLLPDPAGDHAAVDRPTAGVLDRLARVGADPHGRGQLRGVAHEPRVAVLARLAQLVGARLAPPPVGHRRARGRRTPARRSSPR